MTARLLFTYQNTRQVKSWSEPFSLCLKPLSGCSKMLRLNNTQQNRGSCSRQSENTPRWEHSPRETPTDVLVWQPRRADKKGTHGNNTSITIHTLTVKHEQETETSLLPRFIYKAIERFFFLLSLSLSSPPLFLPVPLLLSCLRCGKLKASSCSLARNRLWAIVV